MVEVSIELLAEKRKRPKLNVSITGLSASIMCSVKNARAMKRKKPKRSLMMMIPLRNSRPLLIIIIIIKGLDFSRKEKSKGYESRCCSSLLAQRGRRREEIVRPLIAPTTKRLWATGKNTPPPPTTTTTNARNEFVCVCSVVVCFSPYFLCFFYSCHCVS